MDEAFFPEFHSGLIRIQTVFANVNKDRKRERERETGTFTSFRENQCIDRSTRREREMFFFNFVIFLTLRTSLRFSKFRVKF